MRWRPGRPRAPAVCRPREPGARSRARHGHDVTRRWRAEHGLERRLVDYLGLGQEGEDAAPAVVHDDEGAGHGGQVDQPRHVVQEGQVTEQADDAAPASFRSRQCGSDAEGSRDDTVNPVGPAVGQDARHDGLGLGEPFEVADRHGRRDNDRGALRRRLVVHRARDPGLADSDRLHGAGHRALSTELPGPPTRQPRRIRGSRAPAPSMATSSHASTPPWWNSVATRSGSAHCPKGSTTTTRASLRAASDTYSTEGSRQPRGPEEHDALGEGRTAPDDRIRRADRPRHAAARQWIGQHGPAEAIAQGEDATRIEPLRVRGTHDEHPAPAEGRR